MVRSDADLRPSARPLSSAPWSSSLLNQFANDFAAVDRRAFHAPVVLVESLQVIEPEQVQDGGVNVMHVGVFRDGAQADLVGLADDLPASDPGPGHPH